MNLSDLIPIATLHLWANSKDEARTISRARRLVEHFNPDLNDPWVPMAAKVALEHWNPGSRNRYRASLGSLLRAYAMTGGPRLALPPVFKESKPKDRVMTKREEKLLLESEVGELVAVLVDTGMRISEVFRARIDKKTLVLEETKNGDVRRIPMSRRVRKVCEGHRTLTEGLELTTTRTARRQWERACSLAGINGLTFHCLRHTAITRWAEAGMSLPVIKALAGHRSTDTTLRYLHLSDAALAKEISAFDLGVT
jgi:integrase